MRGRIIAGAVCLAGAIATSTSAPAQQVISLSSTDGSYSVTGELKEFDGLKYVIQTSFGDFSIDADNVLCEGAACPDASTLARNFAVLGVDDLVDGVLPELFSAFNDYWSLETHFAPMEADGVGAIVALAENGDLVTEVSVIGSSSAGARAGLATRDGALAFTVDPQGPGQVATLLRQTDEDGQPFAAPRTLALDGLAILVSPENSIRALSLAQIADIFSGRIDNWSALGGRDLPIHVYRLDDETGATEILTSQVLGEGRGIAPGAVVVDQTGLMAGLLVSDPAGIGYDTFAEAGSARALGLRQECGITTYPSPFSIAAQDYPLTFGLQVERREGEIPAYADRLLSFLATAEAQSALERSGRTGTAPREEPFEGQGQRYANAILTAAGNPSVGLNSLTKLATETRDASRLSTTFRFERGNQTLSERGQQNIVQLLEYLGGQDLDGAEVLFLGFTDDFGTAGVNASLSRGRADMIMRALRDADTGGLLEGVTLSALGMGEVAPLMCNGTEENRFFNRRVEVWVRRTKG